MTVVFWIIAAGLCVVAAAFIAGPFLLRTGESRDRTRINVELYEDRVAELEKARADGEITAEEFDTLKAELQKNLVSETAGASKLITGKKAASRLPLYLAIAIPVLALPFYLTSGALDDLHLAERLRSLDASDEIGVRETIDALAERMAAQPENDQGWFLLANARMGLEDFEGAADAYRHLVDRFPGDEGLAASYAEALYLAREGVMTESVRAAVERAIELDPQSLPMLELMGMHSFRQGQLATALDFFQRALGAGATGERARMIERAAGAVRTVMAERGESPPEPPPESDAPDSRAIEVALSRPGQNDIPDNAVVFVFARAVNGPPMPLAVQRLAYGELPASVRLDESMSMLQGVGLANFDEVQVVARVTLDGNAQGTPVAEQVSGVIDLTADVPTIELVL